MTANSAIFRHSTFVSSLALLVYSVWSGNSSIIFGKAKELLLTNLGAPKPSIRRGNCLPSRRESIVTGRRDLGPLFVLT